MRKKGFVPLFSASILLTLPEGVEYRSAVNSFLENQGSRSQPFFFNPDGETVTIGLVRKLLRHSSFARAASEPQTLIVCAVHTTTVPAQNALLKIVEEPPANTQLILATYPGRTLLPTLISRCREIIWTESNDKPTASSPPEQESLKKFLIQPEAFSYSELIDLAETFKDNQLTQQVLRAISRQLAADNDQPVTSFVRRSLLAALTALEKNGNIRLVMEHCLLQIRQQAAST